MVLVKGPLAQAKERALALGGPYRVLGHKGSIPESGSRHKYSTMRSAGLCRLGVAPSGRSLGFQQRLAAVARDRRGQCLAGVEFQHDFVVHSARVVANHRAAELVAGGGASSSVLREGSDELGQVLLTDTSAQW